MSEGKGLIEAGYRLWTYNPPPLEQEVEYYREGFSEGGLITRRDAHPLWNIYNVWWRPAGTLDGTGKTVHNG